MAARPVRSLLLGLTLCLATTLVAPGAALAGFGVSAFDTAVVDEVGGPYTLAGGHPFAASTTFTMNKVTSFEGQVVPDTDFLKDVIFNLPAGFAGNPTVAPQCSAVDFLLMTIQGGTAPAGCSPSSQIGVAVSETGELSGTDFPDMQFPAGIYNLEPPPGVAAEFGFIVATAAPVFIDVRVNPRDYTVQVRGRGIPSAPVFATGAEATLWGVPADPVHDNERCRVRFSFAPPCPGAPGTPTGPNAAGVPARPFLTNPTVCTPEGVGLETHLSVFSYAGFSDHASVVSHQPPGFTLLDRAGERIRLSNRLLTPDRWGPPQGPTECERVPFNPTFSASPDSSAPDSPTGLSVELVFPQEGLDDPLGTGTAHLRRATVTLPEGMTISPSAAGGLEACSDEQLAVGTDRRIDCPLGSKVGTVVAETPLLDDPVEGAVYIGSQKSQDPESGEMFRTFLVLEDKPRGLLVKLVGHVRANKATGRLEATFDNNPQLPVSNIRVQFKTGPRAPLATPTACGTHTVHARLTAWNGKTADLSDSFTIDCAPGLGGFAPSFDAGTTLPSAGAFSPLVVAVSRPDRQQFLTGVSLQMPGGLLAKLKGVTLCGDAQANAGSCPANSRVGTATVGAGPGSNPFHLQGPVYLTGSYKGAPYGLAVAVRAAAGPFDLGTVVVRQAIQIDPSDGHLTVDSDSLPTVVGGVPTRVRTVHAIVDRPGFGMNPTSCAEKQIRASFTSVQGATSTQSVRFQVGECRSLEFRPKLALRLTGRGQTTDGKHPGLRAVLTQPARQANIRSAKVALPLSLALDPENAASDTLCSFEEGQKADPKCPASSIIGTARAVTPLLNRPLTGSVYFVKNVRIDRRTGRQIRTLPTLLVALRGEVAINLRAQSAVSRNRLVNTFTTAPDAPVSRFELTLNGGRRGILVVTTNQNTCRGKQTASTTLTAQNSRTLTSNTTIRTPCPKAKRRRTR